MNRDRTRAQPPHENPSDPRERPEDISSPDDGRQASRPERPDEDADRSAGEPAASGAEPLYVISVAAKLVRMPAWTLRVLDEQGIVVPKRTDKNRRLYSDKDLARLARVRTLSEEMGINMNGVRLILELEEERDKGDRSS